MTAVKRIPGDVSGAAGDRPAHPTAVLGETPANAGDRPAHPTAVLCEHPDQCSFKINSVHSRRKYLRANDMQLAKNAVAK